VRANTAFLGGSGIALDPKGLVFNTRGQTNDPDVFGAGDVSGKSPIWPVAVKQGLVAGTNMSGGDMELTDFFASKTTMNFWGVKTLSLGIHTSPDESYTTEIEGGDAGYKGYKKIIHKDGKIYGAIIQGDLSYSGILTQLISACIDVSRVRKPLFQIDYSDFFNMKDNFEFSYMEV
jgi:NAD(P)H-nitrite reductase large subunit